MEKRNTCTHATQTHTHRYTHIHTQTHALDGEEHVETCFHASNYILFMELYLRAPLHFPVENVYNNLKRREGKKGILKCESR